MFSPFGLAAVSTTSEHLANNRIALIGHSMLDHALGVVASPRAVTSETRSIAQWLSMLSGGRYRVPENCKFAVGGHRASDLINTAISGGGTQISRAAACDAAIVLLHIGRNDFANSVTLTSMIADITTALNTLTAAGKTVLLMSEIPAGNASFSSTRLTTAQLRVAHGFRDWVIRRAPLLWPGLVYGVDLWPALADGNPATAGDVLAGATQDGVHPSAYGGWLGAKQVLPVLNALGVPQAFPAIHQPGDAFHATENPRGNLIANGDMTGSSSQAGTSGAITIAGVRPTSWLGASGNGAAQASTLTVAGSQVTGTATGRWYQTAITGTTLSNANPVIQLQLNVSSPDTLISAGDVLQLFGEIEIASGSTGLVGVAGSLIRTWSGGSDTIRIFSGEDTSGQGKLDTILAGGNLAYLFDGEPRITWDATATTGLSVYILIQLAKSSTINATVRARNIALRKVV